MKKVGVILAGSGFLDGAEIREAVLTLLALDKANVESVIMAPDMDQYHVVNHLDGELTNEKRNILVEAARIARGNIQNINEVNPDTLDALIMPGGFGVAKNLSNFAFQGSKGVMCADVKDFVEKIYHSKKPIGAICIAPAVLSLLFGKDGVKVTVGNDPGTITAIEELGTKHEVCSVDGICVDQNLKVVSTPAYMYGDAKTHEVYEGIEKCVNTVLEMIS